jgi:hypothetical protein
MRQYKITTSNKLVYTVFGTITDDNKFDFGWILDYNGNDVSDVIDSFRLYDEIEKLIIEQNTPKQ